MSQKSTQSLDEHLAANETTINQAMKKIDALIKLHNVPKGAVYFLDKDGLIIGKGTTDKVYISKLAKYEDDKTPHDPTAHAPIPEGTMKILAHGDFKALRIKGLEPDGVRPHSISVAATGSIRANGNVLGELSAKGNIDVKESAFADIITRGSVTVGGIVYPKVNALGPVTVGDIDGRRGQLLVTPGNLTITNSSLVHGTLVSGATLTLPNNGAPAISETVTLSRNPIQYINNEQTAASAAFWNKRAQSICENLKDKPKDNVWLPGGMRGGPLVSPIYTAKYIANGSKPLDTEASKLCFAEVEKGAALYEANKGLPNAKANNAKDQAPTKPRN